MNSARLLAACFVAVPFFIVAAYLVSADIVTVIVEVVLVLGIFSGIITAALFIISTVLSAFGGGRR